MAFLTIFSIILVAFSLRTKGLNNFDTYYSYIWGGDHFSVNPRRTEAQLKLDKSSGAGFGSKVEYGSGLFHIRMKIPEKKSGGVVTCFYLTSAPNNNQSPGNHFEIDFEFMGTDGTIQTNVFAGDSGNREQRFKLWFDPSKDFHNYKFLWNSYHIVFLVDNIPIREFKNNMAQGLPYLNNLMHIEASIWNATWAGKVNWKNAPFIAHFMDFGLYACPAKPNNFEDCASKRYFWNRPSYGYLNPVKRTQMVKYRKQYMIYDYCLDSSRRKPECSFNA